MKWAGDVTQYERRETHIIFWLENLKGRDHSENVGADGKMILKWILGKHGGKL